MDVNNILKYFDCLINADDVKLCSPVSCLKDMQIQIDHNNFLLWCQHQSMEATIGNRKSGWTGHTNRAPVKMLADRSRHVEGPSSPKHRERVGEKCTGHKPRAMRGICKRLTPLSKVNDKITA